MQATLQHAFRMLLQHTSNAQPNRLLDQRYEQRTIREGVYNDSADAQCLHLQAQPNVSTRRNRHDTVTGVRVTETRSTSGNR